jgi:hypothetical protein
MQHLHSKSEIDGIVQWLYDADQATDDLPPAVSRTAPSRSVPKTLTLNSPRVKHQEAPKCATAKPKPSFTKDIPQRDP